MHMCVCVHVCLWSVAWQPKLMGPIFFDVGDCSDLKVLVTRMGRSVTECKIAFRSRGSSI